MTVKGGYPMRTPTERDQCQAKLDILVEGFMGDDWDAYREAFAWLRDFANLKNTERGRVTCGSRRFTPQAIESVRERARVQQLRKGRQRRRGDRRDQFGRDTRTHLINTPAKIGFIQSRP
jgi:hypothetical protein